MPRPERVVGLLCNYLVYCPDSHRKRGAGPSVLRDDAWIGTYDTGAEQYSIFGIVCENLSRAEEGLAQFRSIYGVVTVRLAIVREIFSVDDWLDERLREAGAYAARSARGPGSPREGFERSRRRRCGALVDVGSGLREPVRRTFVTARG
jgi:hypothetical protein